MRNEIVHKIINVCISSGFKQGSWLDLMTADGSSLKEWRMKVSVIDLPMLCVRTQSIGRSMTKWVVVVYIIMLIFLQNRISDFNIHESGPFVT